MADQFVPWHVKGQPLSRSTDAAAERRFIPDFVSLPLRNLLTEECGAAVVRENVRAVWWCVHLTPRRTLSAVPCALLSFAIKR